MSNASSQKPYSQQPNRGRYTWRAKVASTLGRLARSLVTGGLATLADLVVLTACIYLLGVAPRLASFPALLAGALVQFFGNRHYAFRAGDGCIKRQALWFGASEIVTLGLNALLYDLLIVNVSAGEAWPLIARLISTHVVFLAWSFPVWQLVFRNKTSAPQKASP